MINSKIYFDYNPWWEGKSIPDKYRFPTRRRIYEQIRQSLKNDNIVSLVGPRRVGKTVILYQLIDEFLLKKVDPQKIFYLSCDDPSILVEKHMIEDALDFYEKNILQKSFREIKEYAYFFFDEIQGVALWAEYLKKYTGLGFPVKFIVSGSSSIAMIKNTRESLAGRAKEFVLPPVSFSEYVEWQDKKSPLDGHMSFNFRKLERLYRQIYLKNRIYLSLFEKYIRVGGFPETYSMAGRDRMEYLKKEVIERVLFRDIPETTKIKNPQLTSRLLTFASYETSNVISYQNLSGKLFARFETLSEHLFYLEYSFLISLLKKFSKGGLSVAKSQPKIHVVDSSIVLSLTNKYETIFTEKDFLGRVVESMVVGKLRFSVGYDNIFFWRDERSEVDIILNLPKTLLPIEVKYTNRFTKNDFSGLYRFRSKYQSKLALVLTQDYFGKSEDIIFLPVWFFLFLLPQ